MRRSEDRRFETLTGILRSADAPKPILLLGAGCSISAGMPGLGTLLKRLKAENLDDAFEVLDSDILDNASPIIMVKPSRLDESALGQFGRDARQFAGDNGSFESFFQPASWRKYRP